MDNPLISLGTFVWVIILFYGYLCTLGFWTLYISNKVFWPTSPIIQFILNLFEKQEKICTLLIYLQFKTML